MDNGISPVSCPVCTLYMREGVTLQSHLNTHPKDQVIAALVRISGGSKENQGDSEASCSSHHEQQDFAPPGSSHFTTAITYQQYLSSNGTAPQYISMPTILPAPNSPTHSASNQAAFIQMLYNPYLIQQQQQQQFQLLSSVTSPSHPQSYVRHIVPSVSIPFPASDGYSGTADFPSQGFHNSNSDVASNLPLPPPSTSPTTVLKRSEACSTTERDENTSTQEHQKDVSIQQDNVTYESDNGKVDSCITGVATQTIQYEDEDQKSLKNEHVQVENEEVQVTTDLNDAAVSPMNNQEDGDQYLNNDVSQISGIIMNALRMQSPPSGGSENEYITCDQPEKAESEEKTSEIVKDNSNNDENSNRFIDLDSSETVNIIEIDGIHILVPSEFLEKSAAMLENSEEIPREPENDAASVNIQTDETMPPRGELSEQESVGGNDSSMWVQVRSLMIFWAQV
ncbi:hypothetical protein L9F63_020586 [Diploptera punctata]|uniref:C2H2-type domain-containing protein n=1 Tax=Diploptera punctata TaxID=6984 RepID=A0AAD7ZQY2_DIPPU|nr:hypothetical protein L9F63_020586 [Diploptera punctata]